MLLFNHFNWSRPFDKRGRYIVNSGYAFGHRTHLDTNLPMLHVHMLQKVTARVTLPA